MVYSETWIIKKPEVPGVLHRVGQQELLELLFEVQS